MIKAVAGGGGRGMRVVHRLEDLDAAYERCQSEARAAFGSGEVYVERLMPAARHIEVQVLGDRTGEVTHLWERECTIQRRHQKLVEVAPSPAIGDAMRERLTRSRVAHRARRALRQPRHLRVSGRRRRRRRRRVRVYRSQSALAGRAYRDRGGHRRRSGPGSTPARRGAVAGGTRFASSRYRPAARLCDSAPNQRRIDGARTAPRAPLAASSALSSRPRGRVSASIPSPIPATPPIPGSTRCSPSSSCVRLRPTSPTPSTRHIAPCASSASRAWRPTWAFSRPC